MSGQAASMGDAVESYEVYKAGLDDECCLNALFGRAALAGMYCGTTLFSGATLADTCCGIGLFSGAALNGPFWDQKFQSQS